MEYPNTSLEKEEAETNDAGSRILSPGTPKTEKPETAVGNNKNLPTSNAKLGEMNNNGEGREVTIVVKPGSEVVNEDKSQAQPPSHSPERLADIVEDSICKEPTDSHDLTHPDESQQPNGGGNSINTSGNYREAENDENISSKDCLNSKASMNTNSVPLHNTLKRAAQSCSSTSTNTCTFTGNLPCTVDTDPVSTKRSRLDLYAFDTGPQMYHIKGPLVTEPIITKNLPKIFDCLPIYGKPTTDSNIEGFFRNKIKEFVGSDLNDEDFSELEKDCSPELLKTGNELQMTTKVPMLGLLKTDSMSSTENPEDTPELCVVKKHKIRVNIDKRTKHHMLLKYRGLRLMPNVTEENTNQVENDIELEPGKDVIYRVRMYRPFFNSYNRDRYRGRNSVFICDAILCGRQSLTALRDRFVCHNDFDMRVDVSNNPDHLPETNAKDVFPSGFLFINNTFYVDTRPGCIDTSRVVREWAQYKNIGHFPMRDMCAVHLEDLVLKLGYPEVYVHQGDCEHVFLFSEVRLLGPRDLLRLSNYPYSTAVAHNQTVYCTTCAEFCTKWIVVGCNRVPFDPAYFCDTCFRQYLYKDGKKIGDFKAYSYRGVTLNLLKPAR